MIPLDELRATVGAAHVITDSRLEDYEHDGTFLQHGLAAAVLPADTSEVSRILRLCSEARVPVTCRGAGSGLVGGPVPLASGIVLSLERFTNLEIDSANLVAVAGAGVINANIDEAAAQFGLMYPPDPASKMISTIGGNVACNSGGPHCLKYGLTADYVIGMTVVLASGEILELGGRIRKRSSGYRMLHLFVGSEGTLGVITQVIVKLVPRPRNYATAMVGFDTIEDAAGAVRRVLQLGHLPAALELVSREVLEMTAHLLPRGFKPEHEAVLVIEHDGNDREQVLAQLAEMVEILDGVDNRVAQSEAEREGIWKARREFGRILVEQRKNVFSEDVAVPISQIPEMVHRLRSLSDEYGIRMPTVAHAGDGNLHPALVFDDEQRPLVGELAAKIFEHAIALGGTISAEHGLGALKRDFAAIEHTPEEIAWWRRLKESFDPLGILNPHKIFPEQPADADFLDHLPGWGRKLASGHGRSDVAT